MKLFRKRKKRRLLQLKVYKLYLKMLPNMTGTEHCMAVVELIHTTDVLSCRMKDKLLPKYEEKAISLRGSDKVYNTATFDKLTKAQDLFNYVRLHTRAYHA